MAALNLRLTDEELEAVRAAAAREGISMQELVRSAVRDRVTDRDARLDAAIARVRTEDAELLERLGSEGWTSTS